MKESKQEIKIVSEGKKYRQIVVIETINKKKISRTIHQTKLGNDWYNNSLLAANKRKNGRMK